MTKPTEPKIVWNKGYTPKSKNLADILAANPEPQKPGQDAPPPPIVYLDDDGKATIVPAK